MKFWIACTLAVATLGVNVAHAQPARETPGHRDQKAQPSPQKRPVAPKSPVAKKPPPQAHHAQPVRKPAARPQQALNRHQKACMAKYRSYDVRSDSYALRGKRVPCRL